MTDPDSNGDSMNNADVAVLNLDPAAAGGNTDRDGMPNVAEIGGDLERPMDIDGDGVIDALENGLAAADAAVGGSSGDGTALAGVVVTHGLVGYRSTAPIGGASR